MIEFTLIHAGKISKSIPSIDVNSGLCIGDIK